MKKSTFSNTRRGAGLISLAAAATLTLTACGGEDEQVDEAPPVEQTQEDQATDEAEPADEGTEDEDAATEDAATEEDDAAAEEAAAEDEADTEDAAATEAPQDGAGDSAAGAAEVTAPGTELSFGEPAVLHTQEREEGDEYYAFGYVQSSVTEIVAGDASFFDQFDNAEEYQGMTPYFIMSEHEVLSAEGNESVSSLEPSFEGVLSDGTPAQGLIVISTGIEECPTEFFDSFTVGATATTCDVALAPEGQEVTGAVWTGVREIDGGYDENAYLQEPIIWQ